MSKYSFSLIIIKKCTKCIKVYIYIESNGCIIKFNFNYEIFSYALDIEETFDRFMIILLSPAIRYCERHTSWEGTMAQK